MLTPGAKKNNSKTLVTGPIDSPSAFKRRPGIDDDGISLFEKVDFPRDINEFALRFVINLPEGRAPVRGDIGQVQGLPTCTATYTPIDDGGRRHWSLNCVPLPAEKTLLSNYAKIPSNVLRNDYYALPEGLEWGPNALIYDNLSSD